MRELEINHDYAVIFGVEDQGKMIYLGGTQWRLERTGKTEIVESQGTTDAAIKYISQPAVSCGTIR